ncbi:MAG: DUF1592 domain-containing protein [Planctomycetales bacterium]|nr:DUF1592 domain-containing protein [Planctomycetales bacterium]
MRTELLRLLAIMVAIACVAGTRPAAGQSPNAIGKLERAIATYCHHCHDAETHAGGVVLAGRSLAAEKLMEQQDVWERALRKLRTYQMPPPGEPRPAADELDGMTSALERLLDGIADGSDVGRPPSLRRLTRREYRNAIRDLLDLELDVSKLLPADEASHGFDNITVSDLSPTLLSRYVTAAQTASRLALGHVPQQPGGETYRIPGDETQEQRVDGLPYGTRGGALLSHYFPQDGEYEFTIRLTRDRNEHVEGLHGPHQLEVLVDRKRMAQFNVGPPRDGRHDLVDAHLHRRVHVEAGRHEVGVTFLGGAPALLTTKRQPYNARYNYHRHPRTAPAIFEVAITGPFGDASPRSTSARRRVLGELGEAPPATPATRAESELRAEAQLRKLARLAFRRPPSSAELSRIMEFYRQGAEDGDEDAHEGGMELALTSILSSPRFLFRVHREPEAADSAASAASATATIAYPLDDFELATRLSFFLWSSIPDEPLLALAEQGRLTEPATLRAQTLRMLRDPRSKALVDDFASQWLYLSNLDTFTPNLRSFPDFDNNLRRAFRRETELFLASVFRENASVLTLLRSDYTFLNERLAKHYGIPNIYGSRFRRVQLDAEASHRGGLLRHGSVLAITSYATRTSPVIRGNWVLKNLIGAPPPPPPANVPDLPNSPIDKSLSVRERLAIHRSDPACASCHQLMDPIGFALENFDAVGRWRDREEGQPLDTRGAWPDGASFDGIEGLEQSLLDHPEWFVSTLAEKLLTYATGRGATTADRPAIRQVVRQAGEDGYRFSALILGIVESRPFRYRRAD